MGLRYFDFVLKQLDQQNSDYIEAFGSHVHWGYWPDPGQARPIPEEFGQAAERLTQLFYAPLQLPAGSRILDVGCGLGGTVASLNRSVSQSYLVGLNIDERQLARARQQVLALNGNTIEFVQGDACELPFPAGEFDVVLAVECIFHFPDRGQFLQEAARVLRPGGWLVLSDFTIVSERSLWVKPRRWIIELMYGSLRQCTLETYAHLIQTTDLTLMGVDDLSAETQPTYEFIIEMMRRHKPLSIVGQWIMHFFEWEQRRRGIRYHLLRYQKAQVHP